METNQKAPNCPDMLLIPPDDPAIASRIHLPEALRHFRNQTPFIASAVDGICSVKISDYVPVLCVALHDGAAFPAGLEKECLLSSAERRFEEDPHTTRLIETMPMVLSGLESRYFYDLNRAENYATSNEMFDQRVWRRGHHPARLRALSRHRRFYRLAGALIEQMIRSYDSCLILDVHSYNGSKIDRETPLFNLGTCANDMTKHRQLLDFFLSELANIKLPGICTRVTENDVFEGRGRFVNWVARSYPQALPVCLEIKKVYCDELSGHLHHELATPLQTGLTCAIEKLFSFYRENYLQHLCQQSACL
jgi:hypothetical protein